MKNKVIKYILSVIWTAWTGTLTIFTAIVFFAGFLKFADKVLNNNIFLSILLAVVIIALTMIVGTSVKDKQKGEKQ